MLQLQRASAGSGKTYTLAKKFIWFFITVADENGHRRLRRGKEIDDSLTHILAITFTNKATNEMKQRIIEKLAAIATYDGHGKTPDYLEEFARDLGCGEAEIVAVCVRALKTLLNNFGDFNVSTIDSFFQNVLRTFAYEVDINDSYQVELDSKYMAQVGIDSTLDELNSADTSIKGSDIDNDTYFWLRQLMDSFSGRSRLWNVFERSSATGFNGDTSYSSLLKAVNKLENEDFKLLRPIIEEYFNNGSDFRLLYEALSSKIDERLKSLISDMHRAVRDFTSAWEGKGLDLRQDASSFLVPRLARIKDFSVKDVYRPTAVKDFLEIKEISTSSKSFCKSKKVTKAEIAELARLCDDIFTEQKRVVDYLKSEEMRHWRVYRRNLPYLGLMKAVMANRAEFLKDNNLIELSETSTLLRRIIGDDDAPFIYERIGTKLNHFLIDEFQDTSRLQWDILSPLLAESMGRGCDNLIIGDAKQSIYRFRNADPSIINTKVPLSFPGQVEIKGDSPADNTNWRSCRRIVEFNNLFFSDLSRRLAAKGDEMDFAALYDNVSQHIRHTADRGYVRATFKKTSAALSETLSKEIGPLIKSILARGFAMKDIAVLVKRNTEGQRIISDIIDFNASLPKGENPIEFISEESLRLGASEAVAIIVASLENIVKGTRSIENRADKEEEAASPDSERHDESAEKTEEKKTTKIIWDDIKVDFAFFAMQHPGIPRQEQMDLFLQGNETGDKLHELLSGMQSVALPALVEALANTFVPQELRKSDAPYIAAFQDFVLDFCDRRSADIASFLQMWERKGKELSISSPDGLDAVQVMTIHKSKGLEFKCVIIPYFNDRYRDSDIVKKSEWRWVVPYKFDDSLVMPPYMPVNTDALLENTVHSKEYRDFIDLKRMDNINSEYVALTRAVEELYIFADCQFKPVSDPQETIPGLVPIPPAADNQSAGYYLYDWLQRQYEDGDDSELPVEFDFDEETETPVFTIGTPGMAEKETDDDESVEIDDYFINDKIDFLKYREAEGFTDDDEDPDPRSVGNLLHAVMQNVTVADDLPSAVKRIIIKGLASPAEGETLEAMLGLALADPRVASWFDGSMRVMSERSILSRKVGVKRPDRVMIDPSGNVVVVDYKFGEVRSDRRYHRQGRAYMELLRSTGLYRDIRGYIWYVREGKILSAFDRK